MIARIWRGWAKGGNVAGYRDHFEHMVRPHLAALPGFRGCLLLEAVAGDEVEITAMTLWDSLDSIRAFAGADIAAAKVEPAAAAILSRYESSVRHSEIRIAAWPK